MNGWKRAIIILLTIVIGLMATIGPVAANGQSPMAEASSSKHSWTDCASPSDLHHYMSKYLQAEMQNGLTGALKVLGRENGGVVVFTTFFVAECGKYMMAIFKGANAKNLRFVTNFFPTPREYGYQAIKTSGQAYRYLTRKAAQQCGKWTKYKGAISRVSFTVIAIYMPNCQATFWQKRANSPLRQILCPNGLLL